MATQASAQLLLKAGRAPADAQVVRFDAHQRVQHFLMMSSFIVLALTGLPQKFSDLSVSQWWVEVLGGLEMVRQIHHVAGVIMLGDGVYHVVYLGYRVGVQGRFGCFKMLPTLKDLRDAVQMMLYFLRIVPDKPKFDRFSYLEKFDYWAVFWGITVIGGSGIVLMLAVPITTILPGQAVTVAHTLHSDEAILAIGWILVVHMFNVHLAPWVFPFNPAIFSGKMRESRYVEDHPLEWQRIQSRTAPEADAVEPPVLTFFKWTGSFMRSVARRVVAPVRACSSGVFRIACGWSRRLLASVRKRGTPQ